MHRNRSPFKMVRIGILIVIWGFMTYVAIQHQRLGERPDGAPTVHALCPLGGLATLRETLGGRGYLLRTHPSVLILFGSTIILAVVFRRAFCGWICPLGAMQEFFATIGRRLKWRRSLEGSRWDGALRWLKYPALVLVIALTWHTAELVFTGYDPWATYAHLAGGIEEIRTEFMAGAALLTVSLIGSLFVDRLWCRYLCPFGAFLAVVSKVGVARVVRSDDRCLHCGLCDRVCPVDLPVAASEQVTTGECITCGECVNACPAPGALEVRARGSVISPLALGLGAMVIFFGVIGATQITGHWRSLPTSMAALAEHGGSLSAENIRGFMSLQEIGESYGVTAEEIVTELGLPEDTPLDRPVNAIMHAQDREVDEIREVVARWLQEPPAAEEVVAPAPEAPEMTSEQIKGTMTFAEIGDAFGIEPETLLEQLKLPAETPLDKPINGIMKSAGREVTEVREAVTHLSSRG